MLPKISKKTMRAALIVMVVAMMIPVLAASASDNRPTGPSIVNTDGSTTLFPILQIATYQFSAVYPGESATVDSGQGTGSGHGRSALLSQVPIQSGNGGPNDPIDVALASSACSTSDQFTVTNSFFTEGTLTKTSTASPLTCAQLTDVPVAKDAVTILVPIAEGNCIMQNSTQPYITQNQIQAIWMGLPYNGEGAANAPATVGGTAGATQHTWAQFWPACGNGGANIVPTARIIGSGTRQSFFDLTGVIDANEQAEITKTGLSRYTANADVENAISNNPTYMGYTGLAFDNTKTFQLPVATNTVPSAVAPTSANVASSAYPFSRVLHFYYKTGQSKTAVTDLATWLWGSASQGNIEKLGFVGIARSTNPVVSGASMPAPDWDVNADHNGNILDVTSIGGYFGQTGPASGDPNFPNVRGWVRADVNFDGAVNILDITTFGPHFGGTW